MVVLARDDAGSRWGADRIGAKGVIETNPFGGKRIDGGRGIEIFQQRRVCTNRLSGMVIGHDEQNVWPLVRSTIDGDHH